MYFSLGLKVPMAPIRGTHSRRPGPHSAALSQSISIAAERNRRSLQAGSAFQRPSPLYGQLLG